MDVFTHGMLRHTSPFTTIEVELTFLYDFFYSKYFVFYLKGFCCQMIKQLVFHGLFTSFGIAFVYGNHLSLVTQVVLAILIAMELVQFIFSLGLKMVQDDVDLLVPQARVVEKAKCMGLLHQESS